MECCRAAESINIGRVDSDLRRYGWPQADENSYYFAPNSDFANPGLLDVMRNPATYNYNALQAQYRHRVSHGLQALLSYTWSHSIDDASSHANWVNVPPGQVFVMERASSGYDVWNTFSGAASYDIPVKI